VQRDELSRQRQAKAGAFDFLVGRPDLAKLLEHRSLTLRRDADARVADRCLNGSVHRFRPDFDSAALWRERLRSKVQFEDSKRDALLEVILSLAWAMLQQLRPRVGRCH